MVESYEYRCVGAPTCNTAEDTHGHECEAVNDMARSDFYFALAAEQYAERVDELVRERLDRA